MKKNDAVKNWLDRAKSNLNIAKPKKIEQGIFYEDLCFNAQQCVEKSLKALCLFHEIKIPKTHNITFLLDVIEKNSIKIPKGIKKSSLLTDYSVETRYPGDYDEVDKKEYELVVKIAEIVYFWVSAKVIIKKFNKK